MEELSGENIDMLLYESENHRVVTMRAGVHALLVALTGRMSRWGLCL